MTCKFVRKYVRVSLNVSKSEYSVTASSCFQIVTSSLHVSFKTRKLTSTLRSTYRIRQYWDKSISQENEVARENVDCLLRGVTFSKYTETNNNKEMFVCKARVKRRTSHETS